MLIRNSRDAEEVAAIWMRTHGFVDAILTGLGADGGVDVVSSGAIAQVKAQTSRTARPEVQQLYGIASAQGKLPLFFSLGGYARTASEWAAQQGVALFTFDLQSAVEPVNELAATLDGYTSLPANRKERKAIKRAQQAQEDASPLRRILDQLPVVNREREPVERALAAVDGASVRAAAVGQCRALFGSGGHILLVGPGCLVAAAQSDERVRRIERVDLAVGTPRLGPLVASVPVEAARARGELKVVGDKQQRARFMQALQYGF